MSTTLSTGPWRAEVHYMRGKEIWMLVRHNSRFFRCTETMVRKDGAPRYWRSKPAAEAAAQAAAKGAAS